MAVTWRTYTEGTYEYNAAGIDMATVWAAHLPVAGAALVPVVLAAAACHPALSGEYLHEPSYLQWGEPVKIHEAPDAGCDDGVDPEHLVLYYRALTEATALEVAGAVLAMLIPTGAVPANCREVVVTHADDWEWDATITADPPRRPPPTHPHPVAETVDLGSIGPGQAGAVEVAGGPDGGYTLTITTTVAGVPLLMVDTEAGTCLRIDAGDAVLALVEAGGDQITPPAHWREFRTDPGPAPR